MRPSHPAQPSTKAFYYYIKISMDITRINLFLRSSDVQGRVINTLCFDSPQRNVETLKPFRWLPIPIYQLLTMLSLVHLPPELILEIIQGYLNISDSFHLIQVSEEAGVWSYRI
ncbi:hypothetical protein FRC14_007397 [Serendipita sp. 396]|nr:hypothetical protein FRC14_007397 [Serendipita sp. 396]KAG8777460.1 hypothetical protein FRC15_011334 [Serendipita sp. 397]KAG8794335.1 hypothetical protein FRC16_010568 [Serendipita sp. 398]KAG8848122.1 hypothetical protein FRB91_011177 [Serendipita sp. 411]KAG8862656.1 hypothetical protein FRC20_011128 [Serendipita sp. 405]